ncbi:hypothetical protein GCM10020220_100100 [Nonomuraea rubra]|uniref:hypothetical protein n=1 Tax=Nonomuraea rubra TaxID=46180 RepID=UPI0031E95E7D
MDQRQAAVSHALVRAHGPVRLGAGVLAAPGMIRLTRPDSTGDALPVWARRGDAVRCWTSTRWRPCPWRRSGETRRVLAAVLKCCWTDLSVDPWPGDPAPVELVLDTYRELIGRTDDLMRNWARGALRRLHDSAWVVMDDGVVLLGPRCALWPVEAHAQLQELVRRLPEPERPELTVVGDADIVAAARAGAESSRPSGPAVEVAEPLAGSEAVAEAEVFAGAEVEAGAEVFAGAEVEARTEAFAGAEVEAGAGRVEGGAAEFDDLLGGYDERRRAELVAAFMVVEHAAEPVQEVRFAALRDPALRRTLGEMLARRGRTLIQHRDRWISGYDDGVAATVGALHAAGLGAHDAGGPPGAARGPLGAARGPLGVSERAVLTLVLVHSVAIPRAEGLLPEDSWLSPHPTPVEELRRHTQLPIGELESALRTLRHAGLLGQVKAGEEAGGYVPGPQFHRLTAAARRRLQEELILAAGPNTPARHGRAGA